MTIALVTGAIMVTAVVAVMLLHSSCLKWMLSMFARCISTRSDVLTNSEVSAHELECQDMLMQDSCNFLPLIGDPEDAIKAWRCHKEQGNINETEPSVMPTLFCYPKCYKTTQTHCQCISPGVRELLQDFCGKLVCFTLGLGCCCASHIGIEENGQHADNPQEITHKWSIEQAHDLTQVTINLGDPTPN